jgi:hypothetical protein
MLFDVKNDPYEQHDLAPQRPEVVRRAMTDARSGGTTEMMRTGEPPG